SALSIVAWSTAPLNPRSAPAGPSVASRLVKQPLGRRIPRLNYGKLLPIARGSGVPEWADKYLTSQPYVNFNMSGCGNGTRAVLRRIGGIHFNLRFGTGEFLDKSSQRQLGTGVELVIGCSARQFAVGDDHEHGLESGGHPAIHRIQFSPSTGREFRHDYVANEQLQHAAPELRRNRLAARDRRGLEHPGKSGHWRFQFSRGDV